MPREGADLIGRFGREDVFELAGLLLDFGLAVHGQAVGEEPFGQAMAADDVGGALASARRELDDHAAVAVETPLGFSASWHGFTNGRWSCDSGRMRLGRDQSRSPPFSRPRC